MLSVVDIKRIHSNPAHLWWQSTLKVFERALYTFLYDLVCTDTCDMIRCVLMRIAPSGMIYLRSHLDKYLAVDSFGNVTCEGEEKEPGSKFHIR